MLIQSKPFSSTKLLNTTVWSLFKSHDMRDAMYYIPGVLRLVIVNRSGPNFNVDQLNSFEDDAKGIKREVFASELEDEFKILKIPEHQKVLYDTVSRKIITRASLTSYYYSLWDSKAFAVVFFGDPLTEPGYYISPLEVKSYFQFSLLLTGRSLAHTEGASITIPGRGLLTVLSGMLERVPIGVDGVEGNLTDYLVKDCLFTSRTPLLDMYDLSELHKVTKPILESRTEKVDLDVPTLSMLLNYGVDSAIRAIPKDKKISVEIDLYHEIFAEIEVNNEGIVVRPVKAWSDLHPEDALDRVQEILDTDNLTLNI